MVGYLHTQRLSYEQALAAVFIEGFLFLFLSITGIRSRLMELIPMNIMYSTAAGVCVCVQRGRLFDHDCDASCVLCLTERD